MFNMIRKRRQPNFLSTTVFIAGLALINLIIIWLGGNVKAVTFFGNVIGVGLLFPAVLLYIERKESFSWKRYLYFAIQTAVAIGVIMYLFILRF